MHKNVNDGQSRHPRATWRVGYPTATTVGAAATLYFGYADLWNGGSTMAALLLVMGYIIMVPLAIMAVPRRG